MARFLKETELNLELEKIFFDATSLIMIVSPYIKLHSRYRDILKSKLEDPDLQILLLFGKNDNDITKSISKDDLEFFSKFPKIEIRYEPRLHAKYYANESASIISSMNLYDFSQNNNIEAGILLETPTFSLGNNEDQKAFDYFTRIFDNSELYYKKEPQYSKGIFGLNRKYEKSIVTENKLPHLIKGEKEKIQLELVIQDGICIRCKEKIKLDLKNPFCDKCKANWNKFRNPEYPEKFCHICGKSIQTSAIKPTCYSCYREYKNKLPF